eukprot:145236_1
MSSKCQLNGGRIWSIAHLITTVTLFGRTTTVLIINSCDFFGMALNASITINTDTIHLSLENKHAKNENNNLILKNIFTNLQLKDIDIFRDQIQQHHISVDNLIISTNIKRNKYHNSNKRLFKKIRMKVQLSNDNIFKAFLKAIRLDHIFESLPISFTFSSMLIRPSNLETLPLPLEINFEKLSENFDEKSCMGIDKTLNEFKTEYEAPTRNASIYIEGEFASKCDTNHDKSKCIMLYDRQFNDDKLFILLNNLPIHKYITINTCNGIISNQSFMINGKCTLFDNTLS